MKPRVVSKLSAAILLAQPFLTFPVFISVLLGAPPLWVSWLIALIPWPLRFFTTHRLTRRTPFDIPILLLCAGLLLGFFFSPDPRLSTQVLHTYLACVLFYYGLVNNREARPAYWGFISIFLFSVLSFLTILAFAGGEGRYFTFNAWAYKLASPWSSALGLPVNMNVIGGALAVLVPGLVAVALFRQRTWVRWGAGILAVIFGGILVLSASGGGWIAAAAGVFIVLIYKGARTFWGTSIATVVAVGVTIPVWYRADWVEALFPLPSFMGRLERWQATLAALKDRPLTGLGLGGWWSHLPEFNTGGGPHNAYLGLVADTGVLGLVALVLAIVIGIKLLRQIRYASKDSPLYGVTVGLIAGIIAGGSHALIDDNMAVLAHLGDNYIYFAVPLFWLWAALLVVSGQRLLQGNTDNPTSAHRTKRSYIGSPPGFLLWLWPLLDRIISKRLRIAPLRLDKTGIMGIELRRHRGRSVPLDSETTVAPGDLLIELHMNNAWFRRNRQGPTESTGEALRRAVSTFSDDLRYLARQMAEGRLPAEASALHGVTILSGLARRLGFTVMEPPEGLRTRLTTFYLSGLRRVYYFSKNKGQVKLRRPPALKEIWMTRPRLLEKYGPRPGDTR